MLEAGAWLAAGAWLGAGAWLDAGAWLLAGAWLFTGAWLDASPLLGGSWLDASSCLGDGSSLGVAVWLSVDAWLDAGVSLGAGSLLIATGAPVGADAWLETMYRKKCGISTALTNKRSRYKVAHTKRAASVFRQIPLLFSQVISGECCSNQQQHTCAYTS